MNHLQQLDILEEEADAFEEILKNKGFQFIRIPEDDGFIYSYLCENYDQTEILYAKQEISTKALTTRKLTT